MTCKYYLLIDLGTGSTRAVLASSEGKTLAVHSFANTYYRDEAYPDAQFFLPAEWEKQLQECCARIKAEFPEIRISAVSAAGARQTIILLDSSGNAFYALPNIDNRGREFMDSLPDPERIYPLSGKWATEDFCAAKLLGLRMRRPEIYRKIRKILSLSEWIAYLFTGTVCMEPSQACETQLYDIERKCWSDELCRIFGISPDFLPPLISAGESAGPIKKELSNYGIFTPDACFIVGGADTQAALLQTGIAPGDIAVVSGTTSPVCTLSEKIVRDSLQRVWVDANLGGNGYITEMNPGVTGLNYQRAKDLLCPDLSYEQLEKIYADKKDFGCTASFSSLLFYERRSLRHGGFFMRSPLDSAQDRTDMLWAVLADCACSIYEQLYRLAELTENHLDTLLCCGGGFRSPALCQMLAELSGREIRLKPGFEQATSAGLITLLNAKLGETTPESSGTGTRYLPRKDPLIRRYHTLWLENRNKENN